MRLTTILLVAFILACIIYVDARVPRTKRSLGKQNVRDGGEDPLPTTQDGDSTTADPVATTEETPTPTPTAMDDSTTSQPLDDATPTPTPGDPEDEPTESATSEPTPTPTTTQPDVPTDPIVEATTSQPTEPDVPTDEPTPTPSDVYTTSSPTVTESTTSPPDSTTAEPTPTATDADSTTTSPESTTAEPTPTPTEQVAESNTAEPTPTPTDADSTTSPPESTTAEPTPTPTDSDSTTESPESTTAEPTPTPTETTANPTDAPTETTPTPTQPETTAQPTEPDVPTDEPTPTPTPSESTTSPPESTTAEPTPTPTDADSTTSPPESTTAEPNPTPTDTDSTTSSPTVADSTNSPDSTTAEPTHTPTEQAVESTTAQPTPTDAEATPTQTPSEAVPTDAPSTEPDVPTEEPTPTPTVSEAESTSTPKPTELVQETTATPNPTEAESTPKPTEPEDTPTSTPTEPEDTPTPSPEQPTDAPSSTPKPTEDTPTPTPEEQLTDAPSTPKSTEPESTPTATPEESTTQPTSTPKPTEPEATATDAPYEEPTVGPVTREPIPTEPEAPTPTPEETSTPKPSEDLPTKGPVVTDAPETTPKPTDAPSEPTSTPKPVEEELTPKPTEPEVSPTSTPKPTESEDAPTPSPEESTDTPKPTEPEDTPTPTPEESTDVPASTPKPTETEDTPTTTPEETETKEPVATDAPTDKPTKEPEETPTPEPTDVPTMESTEAPETKEPVSTEPETPTPTPFEEEPTVGPVTREPITEEPTETPTKESVTEKPTDAPVTKEPVTEAPEETPEPTVAPVTFPPNEEEIDIPTEAPETTTTATPTEPVPGEPETTPDPKVTTLEPIVTCGGVAATSSRVCGGKGQCVAQDVCVCDDVNYSGVKCATANCFGVPPTDSTVCEGNGVCVALDTCKPNDANTCVPISASSCPLPTGQNYGRLGTEARTAIADGSTTLDSYVKGVFSDLTKNTKTKSSECLKNVLNLQCAKSILPCTVDTNFKPVARQQCYSLCAASKTSCGSVTTSDIQAACGTADSPITGFSNTSDCYEYFGYDIPTVSIITPNPLTVPVDGSLGDVSIISAIKSTYILGDSDVTVAWTQTAGPNVDISAYKSRSSLYIPASKLTPGKSYTFQIVATSIKNPWLKSAAAAVVKAQFTAPTVDLGPSQTIANGEDVFIVPNVNKGDTTDSVLTWSCVDSNNNACSFAIKTAKGDDGNPYAYFADGFTSGTYKVTASLTYTQYGPGVVTSSVFLTVLPPGEISVRLSGPASAVNLVDPIKITASYDVDHSVVAAWRLLKADGTPTESQPFTDANGISVTPNDPNSIYVLPTSLTAGAKYLVEFKLTAGEATKTVTYPISIADNPTAGMINVPTNAVSCSPVTVSVSGFKSGLSSSSIVRYDFQIRNSPSDSWRSAGKDIMPTLSTQFTETICTSVDLTVNIRVVASNVLGGFVTVTSDLLIKGKVLTAAATSQLIATQAAAAFAAVTTNPLAALSSVSLMGNIASSTSTNTSTLSKADLAQAQKNSEKTASLCQAAVTSLFASPDAVTPSAVLAAAQATSSSVGDANTATDASLSSVASTQLAIINGVSSDNVLGNNAVADSLISTAGSIISVFSKKSRSTARRVNADSLSQNVVNVAASMKKVANAIMNTQTGASKPPVKKISDNLKLFADSDNAGNQKTASVMGSVGVVDQLTIPAYFGVSAAQVKSKTVAGQTPIVKTKFLSINANPYAIRNHNQVPTSNVVTIEFNSTLHVRDSRGLINLAEPVNFTISGTFNTSLTYGCHYWDEYSSTWSSYGCITTCVTSNSISCSCNHTTDFAALQVADAAAEQTLTGGVQTPVGNTPSISTVNKGALAGVIAGSIVGGTAGILIIVTAILVIVLVSYKLYHRRKQQVRNKPYSVEEGEGSVSKDIELGNVFPTGKPTYDDDLLSPRDVVLEHTNTIGVDFVTSGDKIKVEFTIRYLVE